MSEQSRDCTSFLRRDVTPERIKEIIDTPDHYTGNLYPEADCHTFIENGVVWCYDEGHVYRAAISTNTLFYYPISQEEMKGFALAHPSVIQQFDVYADFNTEFVPDGQGHFLEIDDFATIDLTEPDYLLSLTSKQRSSVVRASKGITLVTDQVPVQACGDVFTHYHHLNLEALQKFKSEHGEVTQENDLLWAAICYSQPYWYWFFTEAKVVNPYNIVCLRTRQVAEDTSAEVVSYCLGIAVDKVFHSIIIASVNPASTITKAITLSQIRWAQERGFRYYDMYAMDEDTKEARCSYKKDFVNTRIVSKIQCNTELPSWVVKRNLIAP